VSKGERRAPVLVENVIGFLSSHDGKFFEMLSSNFADLDIFSMLHRRCKHFVPQSRPRLFIMVFEKSLMRRNDTGTILDGERLDSFPRKSRAV